MNLDERYAQIQERFESTNEFPPEDQERSRSLFDIDGKKIIPRMFEVWTCLAGLPTPANLTQSLNSINIQIARLLPSHVRFYRVIPENYHWETFILKRPDENVPADKLKDAEAVLGGIITKHPSFTITYRGFLVTTEGTIIVKGYGNFDLLRDELAIGLPFASKKQSRLGHISIGRILDPVTPDIYDDLKKLVKNSQNVEYGTFLVDKIKYIHETQWYMETKEVMREYLLK